MYMFNSNIGGGGGGGGLQHYHTVRFSSTHVMYTQIQVLYPLVVFRPLKENVLSRVEVFSEG